MKFNIPHIKLRPRERLLGVGGGLVLLVVLLDRLVLSPWLHHAKTVQQEIQRMEQSLQTHARLLERKESILSLHERHGRYLRLPIADDLQMTSLLREIEDLAQRSDVDVGEIKPSSVEATTFEKRYLLDVQFQCTLDAWVEFIYLVETSTSLYEVVRAGLSQQENDPTQLDGYLRLVSATSPTRRLTMPSDDGAGDVAATP